MKKLRFLLIIAYTFFCAALAGYFANPSAVGYNSLLLPQFMPKIIFLYFALAVAYAVICISAFFAKNRLVYIYALSSALNALWCYAFFEKGRLFFAFVICLILFCLSVYLIKHTKAKPVKILFAPYLLWLCFLLVINYVVIMMN
ncbi:MAG: tryptophan-rich sensory protein [Clostridia bacterium]|nr:tryptophan-rich sensory protein [Clostridia bacterium]